MAEPFNEPAIVIHEDSKIVDGPDDIEFSMTPAAALVTASRLESEAMDALLERGSTVVQANGPE